MTILFSNNALTRLAAGISDSDTILTVTAATGGRLPAVSGTSGDYFVLTLENAAGVREFVKVTHRVTDTLGSVTYPCVRAHWGSTAVAWLLNDSVDIRWAVNAVQDAVGVHRSLALAGNDAKPVFYRDRLARCSRCLRITYSIA